MKNKFFCWNFLRISSTHDLPVQSFLIFKYKKILRNFFYTNLWVDYKTKNHILNSHLFLSSKSGRVNYCVLRFTIVPISEINSSTLQDGQQTETTIRLQLEEYGTKARAAWILVT
jgi:hypothetical protein